MPDFIVVDKEKHMKHIKRRMESWREVILPLNSILLWERSWYPGLILGLTTTIFFVIWILEPAILTIISACLLSVALLDYFIPILTSTFCSPENWNGQKEKKLIEICQNISNGIIRLQNIWISMVIARNNRRNIFYFMLQYYGGIIVFLMLFAWIGNIINNLLLFYIAVNLLVLWPGLRHKGRAQSAIRSVKNYLIHRKSS